MSVLPRSLAYKIGFGLLVFLLCVYGYSAARTNVGYGDSDELITAGYQLGVAHPSGFPLTIVLIKLFTLLPISGSVAFKAHLLAAVLHSFTVLILYAISLIVIDQLEEKIIPLWFKNKQSDKLSREIQKNKYFAAIGGVLLLAFSPLFWLYSSVIEVFSLNNFLATASVYTGLRWYIESSQKKYISTSEFRWFIATCVITGVGLSHVHVFVMMLPGLALLLLTPLWKQPKFKSYLSPKIILSAIISVVLSFILPNALLMWLNSHQADFSWAFLPTLNGWWHHILRQDYSGYLPEKQLESAAYLANLSIGQMIRGVIAYSGFLLSHFRGFGVGFGLLGAWVIWKYNRKLAIPLIGIALIAGFGFAMRTSFPIDNPENLEYRMASGITQRQFLLGHTMWALLMPIGVWVSGVWLIKKYQSLAIKLLSIFTTGMVVFMIVSFYQMGIQRNNTLISDYAHQLLDTVEDEAVILCLSDVTCYALMYAQHVEEYRPAVTVLIKNNRYQYYFLQKNPQYQGYSYESNPFFSADLISWNAVHRPTYLSEPSGFYIDYVGMEGEAFYLAPKGQLFQIVKQLPDSIPEFEYPITEQILSQPPHPADTWFTGYQDYLTSIHMTMGVIHSKVGNQQAAQQHFLYAVRLSPYYQPPIKYLSQLNQYKGDPKYQLGSVAKSVNQLLSEGDELLSTNQLDAAYKKYQYATYADPLAVEPRLKLIQLYKRGGFYQNAFDEAHYLLKYHPDNQDGQKELQLLEKYDS